MNSKPHSNYGAQPELNVPSGGSGGQWGVQGGPECVPVPGEQRVQVLGLGLSADDPLEYVGQPSHGVDGMQLGRLDQRHGHGPVPRPTVGTGEQGVLAGQGAGTDGAFDHVRVHLDPAVIEKHHQAGPMPDRVADRLGKSEAADPRPA